MSRQMIDSGADWIGEIPNHWETTKLKYIFSIKKDISNELGHDILSVTQSGIKIKDISKNEGQISADYSKYQLVDIDDFVMNHMDLLTGWVDCSRYQGVTSPDYRVFKLIDAENYCKKFYTYLFQACYMNKIFYGLGQGVSNLGRWRLQTDKFLNFMLPIMPLTEQQAIAQYLDHSCADIDNIIQNTKASIDEYKVYKQAIITEIVTKGLNTNVSTKDSGIEWIGDIPDHWEITKIKYLAELAPKCDTLDFNDETEVVFAPMECIKNGYYLTRTANFGTCNSSYNMFETGDIAIAKVTPCFENGNIAVMNDLVNGFGFGSSELFVLRCFKVNTRFLFYYLQNKVFIDRGKSTMTGTGGLKRVSAEFLKNYYICLPDQVEQQQIADYLDIKCTEIDNLISQKKQILLELETFKKSLIYECVTGKRDVGVTETKHISTIAYPLFPAILATNKKRFAQAVLASKVIDIAHTSQFGRVKLEKILYTIETHIGFDFDTDYKRQIAGPLDGSIYQCENMISQRNKWFKINVNKNSVKYSPAKDMAKYKNYYHKYYADYAGEIERIINIFSPLSTDEAELFATLYASWNDFIIRGNAFTEEDIVSDVLNNWHDSKKRFSKDKWIHTIEQLKQFELVPKGYGKKTVKE